MAPGEIKPPEIVILNEWNPSKSSSSVMLRSKSKVDSPPAVNSIGVEMMKSDV